jgi:hypothetical protein
MRSASNRWGGARANAGRPASGPIASEPHKPRPALSPRHPVHVIARVVRPWSLRDARRALAKGLRRAAARADFRVVAFVVRKHRLELVVEADSAHALARGMQGLQVAMARRWNRAHGTHGPLFPDRYRGRALRTRAEVRSALATLPVRGRIAWPATYLLTIELAAIVPLTRLADPDP